MPKLLDYIQLDGNQYFDSGYVPSIKTGVQILFQATSASPTQQRLCGCIDTNVFCFCPLYINGSGYMSYIPINKNASGYTQLTTSYLTNLSLCVFNRNVNNSTISRIVDNYGTQGTASLSNDNTAVNANGLTMYICACNNGGGQLYGQLMRCKLYEFAIFENNVAVRHFVPAMDENDVVCLYEIVTKTYHYNMGTGNATYGNVVGTIDDTLDTKLDFIILNMMTFKTNYKPTPNSRLIIEYEPRFRSPWFGIIGCYSANNNNYYNIENSGSNPMKINATYRTSGSGTHVECGNEILGRTRIVADIKNRKVYVTQNGTTNNYSLTSTINATAAYPMCILGRQVDGGTEVTYTQKLFLCEVYEDDRLKHSWVPWRNADGNVCLYDQVTHEFLLPTSGSTNTGMAIAGPTDTSFPRAKYETIQYTTHEGGDKAVVDDRFYSLRGSYGGTTIIQQVIMTTIPTDAGTCTGIQLSSLPTKLTYNEGDLFELDGIRVMATYSSGALIDVTSLCTCTVDTPLQATTTSATISYETFSLSVPIQVVGNPVSVPAGAVHIFHFDGDGYDALENYESGGTQQQVSTSTGLAAGYRPTISTTTQALKGPGLSNSYIKTPSQSNIVNGSPVTISFWAKRTAGSPTLFTYGNVANRYQEWLVTITDTTLTLNMRSGYYQNSHWNEGGKKEVSGAISCADNAWHHYEFNVSSNGIMRGFFDGALVCSGDLTTVTWDTLASERIFKFYMYYADDNNIPNIWIDELLLANAAIHTADFVPPRGIYNT